MYGKCVVNEAENYGHCRNGSTVKEFENRCIEATLVTTKSIIAIVDERNSVL